MCVCPTRYAVPFQRICGFDGNLLAVPISRTKQCLYQKCCRELVAQNLMVLERMAKHTKIRATSSLAGTQFSRLVYTPHFYSLQRLQRLLQPPFKLRIVLAICA